MIATFHVLRWQHLSGMVQALAFDRIRFRNAQGLQFLRVLGTGKGSSTAPSTELRRTALFCVFDDEQSADAHLNRVTHRGGLRESWHVKLRGAGGHGAWRGMNIPNIMNDAQSISRTAHDSPIALITRADVHARSWLTFGRAAKVVDEELHRSDGLLAVVGIGEAPVLRLGTFSLWRDASAMAAFARQQPRHQHVVERTRSEQWYGEEMFARFEPYWSSGTWDGRDPLRDGELRKVRDGNNIP